MRISDWSSDVCSSDLRQFREATLRSVAPAVRFVSSGGWTRTTNQEPWRHEGAWALGCAPLVCRAGGSCRLFRVHPCLRNTLTTASGYFRWPRASALATLPATRLWSMFDEIGRASCRERVCQYVRISV